MHRASAARVRIALLARARLGLTRGVDCALVPLTRSAPQQLQRSALVQLLPVVDLHAFFESSPVRLRRVSTSPAQLPAIVPITNGQ